MHDIFNLLLLFAFSFFGLLDFEIYVIIQSYILCSIFLVFSKLFERQRHIGLFFFFIFTGSFFLVHVSDQQFGLVTVQEVGQHFEFLALNITMSRLLTFFGVMRILFQLLFGLNLEFFSWFLCRCVYLY